MKNKLILIILAVLLFGSLYGIAWSAAKIYERGECLNWKEYAVEHPTISFDQWQIDQCTHNNITLQ